MGLSDWRSKIFGMLLLGLILIDFCIKRWVYFNVYDPITVWKSPIGIDFFIQYVTNRGGAWGMLASWHTPLLIFRIVVILGLIGYLIYKRNVFIVLILAGAIGNVIDSFLYGHVIDMFHFVFWGRSYGIFNFADAMIFLGSFGLICTAKKAHA